MSTLKDIAQAIQTEKNTKVLAKNIKKDITMFGVTGTCDVMQDTYNRDYYLEDLNDGTALIHLIALKNFKPFMHETFKIETSSYKIIHEREEPVIILFFKFIDNDENRIDKLLFMNNSTYTFSANILDENGYSILKHSVPSGYCYYDRLSREPYSANFSKS